MKMEMMMKPQEALQVLSAGDELDEMLGNDPVAALLGLAKSRAPVETGYVGDPGDDPEVRAEFELAQNAAKKLRLSASATLSADEERAMHAFVHLVARPALRVRDGVVVGIPDHWRKLTRDGGMVTKRIRGVGRIDTSDRQHTGTGWFVTSSLLLTNKHVVAQLCGLDVHRDAAWRTKVPSAMPITNAAWAADPAKRPVWDPSDVPSTTMAATGKITRIREIHADLDMALLEIDSVDATDLALPISATGPADISGCDIYLGGYPAVRPNHKVHPALARLLFADADSPAKRVSPGQLVELVAPMPIATDTPRVSHDGSTLDGSSGSPVIDFESHDVVALHFSGQYGCSNYAIPLWLVRNDPFFTANGIVFG